MQPYQEPICQAQRSQAPKERSGHEGEPLAGWLTSPCPSSLISSHFVYPASFISNSLQITRSYILNFTGFPGPALGCLYGASRNHVNFFRAPDGLYFPGVHIKNSPQSVYVWRSAGSPRNFRNVHINPDLLFGLALARRPVGSL